MTEWFDIKLYREAVEPLMNERMRKRLVSQRKPRHARSARSDADGVSEHLDYLDYLLDHRRWLAGPGLSLADFTAAAHLSVIDYLGALDWRGHKQTKDWYAVMKSRPCFRPLLGERMEVIVPPTHYDKVDFLGRDAALREASCPRASARRRARRSSSDRRRSRTGRPVESCSTVSNPRRSEPPPVMVMPWSITSAAISGCVCSSAVRTTSTIWLTGSLSASATCAWVSMISAGIPRPTSRPRTRVVRPIAVARSDRRADLELHPLGGSFADQQVEVSPDIGGDRIVHPVAADARRAAEGQALERDHADLGGAAADVDDHRPDRFGDRKPGADRRRHRLLDQRHAVGAGVGDRVADRAALDRGRARGNADDDLGPAREAARTAVRLADEMLDHLLGDLEVGDHAGAQGTDGAEVVGRLADHQLGVVADRADLANAVVDLDRDDRRLAGDDSRRR